SGLDQLIDELLAEAVDVEGAATREMPQVVLELGRTVEVRAARDRLALESHRLGVADGATRRQERAHERVALGDRLPPPVESDADDLRDDVARPLDHDAVPDPDVLAVELVLVVERRARNRDAADADRAQPRDGGDRARTADLEL